MEGQILCHSTYMKYLEDAITEKESILVVDRDWANGGGGGLTANGWCFLLG